MTPSHFDVVELNEAFAAQSLGCLKELEIDPNKVNLNGGSIARHLWLLRNSYTNHTNPYYEQK